MYEGQLTPAESVKTWVLSQLTHFSPGGDLMTELGATPLSLIDTCGAHMNENAQEDDDSKSNSGEAAIVAVLVRQLLAAGLKPSDLAVISPYNAQVCDKPFVFLI